MFCLIEISKILNLNMGRAILLILLSFLLVAQSMSSCSPASKRTWIKSPKFTKTFQSCSRKAALLLSSINQCLGAGIFKLTGHQIESACLDCFNSSFKCVLKHCIGVCTKDAGSKECLQCNDTHCKPQFMICTGIQSPEELPVPPAAGK